MVIRNAHPKMTEAERQFASWLTTQKNAHGIFYVAKTANHYASFLRHRPLELDIPLSGEERDIYRYRTIHEFDRLNQIFHSAPNFFEVDLIGHRSFSAALAAYRKYIICLENGPGQDPIHTGNTQKNSFFGENISLIPMLEGRPIPDAILATLKSTFSNGFRFEPTSINLLASASGIKIDEDLKNKLKSFMFGRNDDIFFLRDLIINRDIEANLLTLADNYLQEFGCFETSEIYKNFKGFLNSNIIKSVNDFEDYYLWIGRKDARCVIAPGRGHRIARHRNENVKTLLNRVAQKITAYINDMCYGSCTEDELCEKFPAFSKDLLCKIINNCIPKKFIRVTINDVSYYQSFTALGLPENFTEELSNALERLEEIGLSTSQETLHITLSLSLGTNLKSEFGLPDWEAFRRMISAYYNGYPPREWRNNVFSAVEC